MNKHITASLLALLCIAAFALQKDTFTDTRDGKKYKTTKIGEQVWMAENLNYEAEGSKCGSTDKRVFVVREYEYTSYYLKDGNTINCDKYGRLYNWATAMKVCPSGWHLPSNAEWDKLYRYADGDKGTESPYRSKTAGKYLKAKEGWRDDNGKSGNGEDTYGFSALPGGLGNSGGHFDDVGYGGAWWNASENGDSGAYYRGMGYNYERAYSSYMIKGIIFFSVRCVGDYIRLPSYGCSPVKWKQITPRWHEPCQSRLTS
jgi:uncharacterized protein (TIGR02145 family)